MIELAIAGFWIGLLVPVTVYLGYPLAIWLAGWLRPGPEIRRTERWPSVTIAIAAHDEEATIGRAVRTCLAQAYPGPPPRVLVGLDGCSDGTLAVLERIADPRLGYLALDRAGKAATDNRLAAAATSDVIVTTAAGSEFAEGALQRLCEPFRDPTVGCTTGVFVPRSDGSASAAGEGLYWRFEQALMAAESRLGVLAMASGTSMAHRRAIFRPIPLDTDGDVSIAPEAVAQGYRAVFVRDAIVYDDGPPTLRLVMRNRRRMALRALPTTAALVPRLVRAGRLGAALALVMHKLLRWLAPFFVALWAISALALAALGHELYVTLTLLVLVAGLVGAALVVAGGPGPRGAAAGFLLAQLAFALATIDVLRGRRATMWERA